MNSRFQATFGVIGGFNSKDDIPGNLDSICHLQSVSATGTRHRYKNCLFSKIHHRIVAKWIDLYPGDLRRYAIRFHKTKIERIDDLLGFGIPDFKMDVRTSRGS